MEFRPLPSYSPEYSNTYLPIRNSEKKCEKHTGAIIAFSVLSGISFVLLVAIIIIILIRRSIGTVDINNLTINTSGQLMKSVSPVKSMVPVKYDTTKKSKGLEEIVSTVKSDEKQKLTRIDKEPPTGGIMLKEELKEKRWNVEDILPTEKIVRPENSIGAKYGPSENDMKFLLPSEISEIIQKENDGPRNLRVPKYNTSYSIDPSELKKENTNRPRIRKIKK